MTHSRRSCFEMGVQLYFLNVLAGVNRRELKRTDVLRFATAALLFLLLGGCTKISQEEKIAVESTRKLREQFNTGACNSIYEQTGKANDELAKEWLSGCEQMRGSLGSWTTFNDLTAFHSSHFQKPTTVRVEGRAVFTNGDHVETYWLESYWHVSGNRAHLYFLYLEGGGKQIALPHLPKTKRLINPDYRIG